LKPKGDHEDWFKWVKGGNNVLPPEKKEKSEKKEGWGVMGASNQTSV